MKLNTNICSYVFFALMVFNALSLVSSEFFHTFSQIFMLLSHNGRIYNLFSLFFIGAAIFVVIISHISIYKNSSKNIFGKTAPFIVSLFAAVTIVFLLFLLFKLFNRFVSHDILNENTIKIPTFMDYFSSIDFFIMLFCAIFLCILPLIYNILSLSLNFKNRYAKSFLILEPNINTIIFTIAALACHPYFSLLPSKYLNFILLFISCGLLIYLLYIKNETFGFYEYLNMIFLSLIILCYISCSESMLRSNFTNAQNALFMFAIFSWCSEWLQNKEALKSKLL